MARKGKQAANAPKGKGGEQRNTPLGTVKGWIIAVTGPWTWDNLWGWAKIILLVLVIRWALIEPYKIPSGSMEPTLHGDPGVGRGDRVFVNKFHYGLRVPFIDQFIFRWHEPERWEIVVFHAPHEDAQHNTLIKRVVGLPGERVHIEDGMVHINGEPVEPPASMPDVSYFDHLVISNPETVDVLQQLNPAELQRELRLLNQKYPMRYGILESEEYSVVPKDHYFMLGDNSANSVDGRVVGWVPRNKLVGRAFCIWWPPSRWQDFTGFSETWWGMSILYGIPAGAVAYIVYIFVIHPKLAGARRERDATGAESVRSEE